MRGMARVWVLTIAILLASRPASPGCDNPGGSEGFDQCQKYPGCECVSEVIPCAHGTWFTQYYVDPGKCSGPGPRPPAPAGNGSGSGSDNKPKDPCEAKRDMMQKWLDAERRILGAYEDDDLLGLAISQGWSPGMYNMMLWRSLNQGGLPPSSVGVMWTDPRTCKIENYGPGCKWLLQHGLPPSACAIALAHEQVHVQQCKNKDPNFDPSDLQQYRDREVEAHQQTIAAIEKWLHDHPCP